MTTPHVTTRTKRNAFTLTELMIVIVIIGILVGISSPFIYAALTRAKEFTIQNEIVQMDAAVQRFETKHGFFPPAIGPGLEIDNSPSNSIAESMVELAKFRRYLNRIAPNHAEGSSGGLDIWWRDVGSKLDAESSLVFWLSGLCTSKQYPLSGSAAIISSNRALAPYNANLFFNQAEGEANPNFSIDRDVFFEFTSGQLVTNFSAGETEIRSYNQPEGKGDALAYRYRDSKSYAPSDLTVAALAYHVEEADGTIVFFNPGTFQIICPGMDGQITRQTDQSMVVTDTVALSMPSANADPEQDDNITNFANGRLDTVFE